MSDPPSRSGSHLPDPSEEARAQLQRRLAQAQKMETVGRFAGAIAHDFNNLLTVIAGYAMLLQEDDTTAPGAQQKLAEIVHATNRAKDLTHKLLVLSSRHPSEPRTILLDDLVAAEAARLPETLADHISIATRLGAPGAMVTIDPAQLSAMLVNLTLNARDAMPDGGTLTISTAIENTRRDLQPARTIEPGTFVRLSISDTGIGMDDAIQAHLFEPFFTTKRGAAGSGLGLATVYGHVQQAGGFIDIDTAPQRGTTVSVWLPMATTAEARKETNASERPRGGTESLLVVEDEAAVRLLAVTILTRLGYNVTSADGPDEALRLAARGARFDLIVSDVVMPGMDGRALIAELRRIMPAFEVLYVSGYADAGAGDLHADPHHFLAKPYMPAALAKKVRDLLDGAQSGRSQQAP